MNVLMLSWERRRGESGGLGTACSGLDGGLRRQGVQTFWLTPTSGPRRPRVSAYASSQRSPTIFAATAELAHAVGLQLPHQRFDIVHAHDWTSFPAGMLAASVLGCPLVVHVHSVELDRHPHAPDAHVGQIEARAFDVADRILCVSRFTAERVAALYRVDPQKLHVVHNAIDAPAPLPESERDAGAGTLVSFVGRVTEQKDPGTFLEAAALVARVDARARFAIVGDGDGFEAATERAADLGLAGRVRWTGWLEHDEVQGLLGQTALCVLSSVSEPFGLSALEALAAGAAVIVPRGSGITEIAPSALQFDPGDAVELGNLVAAALRYPRLRRARARRARGEALRCDWDEAADRVTRVYREVLN